MEKLTILDRLKPMTMKTLQHLALSVDGKQLASRTHTTLYLTSANTYTQSGLLEHLRHLDSLISLRLLKMDGMPDQFVETISGDIRLNPRGKHSLIPATIASRCARSQISGALKYIMVDYYNHIALAIERSWRKVRKDRLTGDWVKVNDDQSVDDSRWIKRSSHRLLNRDEIRAIPIFAIRDEVGLCGLHVVEQ